MKNNSVHLIGTLTRDIELSRNSKGNSFARFTLACTRDNKPFTDFTVLPLVKLPMHFVNTMIKIQPMKSMDIFV